MTIKRLYDLVVNESADVDKQIKYLEGKRDILNGVRLNLYAMLLHDEKSEVKVDERTD